jgi:aspartate/methionine/tyrosine aminotransferase
MPTDISAKTRLFTESVIREMRRAEVRRRELAQGFPDFAAPTEIKEAACARSTNTPYGSHGSPNFRRNAIRCGYNGTKTRP